MIDPNAVTDTARTDAQLEEFLLFCVVVAGKNADQQARKLEAFLQGREPFALIRSLKGAELGAQLRRVKLGKYALLTRSFRALAGSGLDLRRCAWADLAALPGIGIKTAKFFVLHSRPGQMHGVLDTHVLAWMRGKEQRSRPGRLEIPRHSPQDPAAYAFWESLYFGLVCETHHQTCGACAQPINWARVDLDLWKEQRSR